MIRRNAIFLFFVSAGTIWYSRRQGRRHVRATRGAAAGAVAEQDGVQESGGGGARGGTSGASGPCEAQQQQRFPARIPNFRQNRWHWHPQAWLPPATCTSANADSRSLNTRGDTTAQGMPEKIIDLPERATTAGANILFNAAGTDVCLDRIGSHNDAGSELPAATIMEFNPDGTGGVFSHRHSKSEPLAWQPGVNNVLGRLSMTPIIWETICLRDYATSVKDVVSTAGVSYTDQIMIRATLVDADLGRSWFQMC